MISILEAMSPGRKAALATGATGAVLLAPEAGAAISKYRGGAKLRDIARAREGVTEKQLTGWKEKAGTVKGREELKPTLTTGKGAEAGEQALKHYDTADTFKSISPLRVLGRYGRKGVTAARKAHDEAQ
jgi:hypothetical protein